MMCLFATSYNNLKLGLVCLMMCLFDDLMMFLFDDLMCLAVIYFVFCFSYRRLIFLFSCYSLQGLSLG
jgi:hypothetical protein